MPIYLDHAATTPLRREVLDAMLPYLTEHVRQPVVGARVGRRRAPRSTRRTSGSPRALGARSRARSSSRRGGTEANNLALKGAAWAGKARGHRIVTSVGRAPRGPPRAALPREVRLRDHRAAGRPLRPGRPRRRSRRRSTSGRSSSRSCSPTTRSARSSRSPRSRERVRDAQGRLLHVDAVQAAPYVDLDVEALGADLRRDRGPQVRRPQGRRRALAPARDAHPRAAARRQPGALSARRHRGRGRCRRHGARLRARRARSAPRPSTRLRSLRERLQRRALAVDGRRADRPPDGSAAGPAVASSSATPTAAPSPSHSTSRASRQRRLGMHHRLRRGQSTC